jgi:hypothetical protein
MSKSLSTRKLIAASLLGAGFISYLIFTFTMTAKQGYIPLLWVVLAFIFIFGLGFFLGMLGDKFSALSKNCLITLVVGNIVISLVQDPSQLSQINSNNPGYVNAQELFAGIAGLCCLLAIVAFVLAYSLPAVGAIIKKIALIGLIVIAVLYLASGICYFWAGEYWWMFFGLFTAALVYLGFYFAIPEYDK